jgi:murein DD-endopeptidase MepM/ murein hydrolase activator NlpD
MRGRRTRLLGVAVAASLLALAVTAAAPSRTPKQTVSARAVAVRILLPAAEGSASETVDAPPDGGFSYPDDGSVITAASVKARTTTATGKTARAQAAAEVVSVTLFDGEVTVARVGAHARAAATGKAASGDTDGTIVSGLTVLGQPAATGREALGDWGYADVSAGAARRLPARGSNAFKASVLALSIRLTADHGGLPAGAQILIGLANATAKAAKAAPSSSRPKPKPSRPKPVERPVIVKKRHRRPPEPKPSPFGLPRIRTVPRNVTARLTPRGYVFPVFGASSWSDTFGEPRADTGWHHGEDIFASLGAPVLAVNDGWVSSVGYIPIGGNRLWLRDEQGNQFYYAHLSAFSPLAVNGLRVRAGDVLGFVGNTGDASGTPYHLHFEIHPVGLLRLGYDGVVNPTRLLSAWQHLQDLPFPSAASRFAGTGGTAPVPGAILLQAADISQANGLIPRSLEQALDDPARSESDGALLRRG